MLNLNQGSEILLEIGQIATAEAADELLSSALNRDMFHKLGRISSPAVRLRIANAIAVCAPDDVFIHDGSSTDQAYIRSMAIESGEERSLGNTAHTCHFDLPEDQGRLVDQTYYVTNDEEEVSVLSRSMSREAATAYLRQELPGIMRGKTLLVGFYSRGPIGAFAALPAIQMTDSYYIVHSADLLYANAYNGFEAEVTRAGHFFTNLHSKGQFRSEDIGKARIFMDRSWMTTFSVHCTYAGNTLLLKKGNHRFAVDRAVYFSHGRELSEHMFITGLTGPGGRRTFFAGAAPSGCGKTTTALVGSDLIGDDLAQLWVDDEGTLRAINPETGVFGIVQDVNRKSDPILMTALEDESNEVIWSNILIDERGRPRWEGDGRPPVSGGHNWLGQWRPDSVDEKGRGVPVSHPNARFTVRSVALRNYNRGMAKDPAGVPIRVITYSGRDSNTMPPVWVAESADAGVVIGASILSVATATEVGVSGIKRQPWANAAFIPGPLADYMRAQFEFFNSSSLLRAPLMAGLNYFLTDAARGGQTNALLGEKADVIVWLSWLERRAHDEVQAIVTPIGFIPTYHDLEVMFADILGKPYSKDLYNRQFSVYVDNILYRIGYLEDCYRNEAGIPERLFEVYQEQRGRLLALKERYGVVVLPQELAEFAKNRP